MAPTKGRLSFLDLLRGWAVLVMVEVHVFNAFMLPEFRTTPWFEVMNFINGLVAPSFTFISGFVFLLASQKKLPDFRNYGSAFWKQISRIALIWIVGYFLHLPFFSFHRTVTETTAASWLRFYQSDVLHCIAFGLMVLFLLRLFIRNDSLYKNILLVSGFAVVFTALFIWDIDFLRYLPAPIAAYMNSQHYSLFPLFPWLGFMLFGGYIAIGYIAAREQGTEKGYMKTIAGAGAVLAIVTALLREVPMQLQIGASDVRANPLFFFERFGIIMLLLVLCWWYAEKRKTENSFVLVVGRESLFAYAGHLLIIYGQFINDRSLSYLYGKTMNVVECTAGTLILASVVVCASMFWGWMKRNHLPLARVIFWMVVVTLTLWFFMH
jgi:uncharacterized membrane protein